jgi:hypothetical protein
MKIKKIAAFTIFAVVAGGAVAAGIYYALTRDPTPIKMDPKLYDNYAAYYDFGHGYIVTIHREGNRLISSAPEQRPKELFPETETQFFFKGNPARITFHRDEKGRADHVIVQWKKFQQKAERIAALPPIPEFTNAMIAATTGGKAVEAGLEILKEGGTAADAALATALCEVVHAGGSYVSFGGPLLMLYFDAASGKVYYLDAQYNTPLEEKDPRSIPKNGGRTALVPGFMAGVQAAHDRFGKVPFKRLFDHAIALAENGEIVSPVMEWWIDSKKSVLSRFPDTMRIFTKSDGKFYATGDLFRQPELAGTLRKVAAQGASCMYEGEWGQQFVEVIRRNGGKITQQDMKHYKATWEEPLHLFKGWKHGAGLLGGDSDRSVQPPDERRRVTRIGGTISRLLNPEKARSAQKMSRRLSANLHGSFAKIRVIRGSTKFVTADCARSLPSVGPPVRQRLSFDRNS